MTHHKSYEFKLLAVNLYIKYNSIRKVAKLLDCSKSSLQRWIERYFETGDIVRKEYNRKSKITDEILRYIEKLIKENPAIILSKINKKIYKKFNISITKEYIHYLIKYKLNITYKQLRLKYYPEKKLGSLRNDKIKYYETLKKYTINNIISIDETGFYLNMHKNFGRCDKGKRCYKTIHKYPYVKYNFLCAIKYGKVIGYQLYEKESGGIDAIKLVNFYNKYIKNKYKNHLIILDNANFHKSNIIKEAVEKSDNKIIYSLPYNPDLNPIENLFSQLKNYIRNKSPDNYNELKLEIDKTFTNKIKEKHLKNYFNNLFLQADEYIKKHKK